MHIPSPDDRTVIACRCGWLSAEMTKEQKGQIGIPWYCDDCGQQATLFATFHPRERKEAYEFLVHQKKGESIDAMRKRRAAIIANLAATA